MILDTNALSSFAEGEAGATRQISRAGPIAIPVIVLGEYRFGIAQSRRWREYERWLEELVSVCRVLDVNEVTAIAYAQIRVQLKEAGTPIPSNDAWIAALCRQHSLPVLSRDRHFDLIPEVRRLAW